MFANFCNWLSYFRQKLSVQSLNDVWMYSELIAPRPNCDRSACCSAPDRCHVQSKGSSHPSDIMADPCRLLAELVLNSRLWLGFPTGPVLSDAGGPNRLCELLEAQQQLI